MKSQFHGASFSRFLMAIFLIVVSAFAPSAHAQVRQKIRCQVLFLDRAPLVDGKIDDISVQYRAMPKGISPPFDLPLSSKDAFIMISGAHVALVFEGRVLESFESNHLILSRGYTKFFMQRYHGIVIRIRGLDEKQIAGLRKVVGQGNEEPSSCLGFTCAQVATQALGKGTGIHTSRTGLGTLTISETIRAFARMQAAERDGDQLRIEFYAGPSKIEHVYRFTKQLDKGKIAEARNVLAGIAAGASVFSGVAWALGKYYFGFF